MPLPSLTQIREYLIFAISFEKKKFLGNKLKCDIYNEFIIYLNNNWLFINSRNNQIPHKSTSENDRVFKNTKYLITYFYFAVY